MTRKWSIIILLILVPVSLLASDFEVGGALRFNYFYKDWPGQEANQKRGGDWAFDTFRLNVDGTHKDVKLSAEYRFYSGYNMLHHGWLGYEFNDNLEARLGVNQVPFGILPYASHNWFFQIPYYLGFEDDYDSGLKLIWKGKAMTVMAAFYKNCEGSYTGKSDYSARYSYDVVPEGEGLNSETNQFNLRLAYNTRNFELGVSGETGRLYNSITKKNGDRLAYAFHVDGTWKRLNIKCEWIQYEFNPENPQGFSEDYVIMGAYDSPYNVAAKGAMGVAGLSYSRPVEWGPVSNLTFYDNFSYLIKDNSDFHDSKQNVLGVMITMGSVYTYCDIASGVNQPWIGPNWTNALSKGVNDSWHTRVNFNIGYYF